MGALSDAEPYRVVSLPGARFPVRFLNAFAVNDAESASRFIDEWKQRIPGWERTVVLFNTRSDRPLRSMQFARWCASSKNAEMYILMGTHVPRTQRELLRQGVPASRIATWSRTQAAGSRIATWSRTQAAGPMEAVRPYVTADTVVVGVGNMAGEARRFLESEGML
jgi:hypothetical protein